MTKNLELLFSDNFFAANPAKVMGEPYTTSGRFGPVTKYRGTIDDVLRIAAPDYTVADMLSPWVSSEHTTVTPAEVHKAEKTNIRRALQAAKDAVETPQQELWSFEDVDAQYNAHISHDEKVAFVWYMQSLGRSMSGGWRKYWIEEGDELSTLQRLAESGALFYDGNTKQKLVPGVVYFSGNIYEKRAQLEKDRDLIIEQYGEKAYAAQQEKVDDFFRQVYDRRLTIDHLDPSKRLKILPTSRLASDFKIKSLNSAEELKAKTKTKNGKTLIDYKGDITKGWGDGEAREMTLQGAFVWWMRKFAGQIQFKKGVSYHDITLYYIEDARYNEERDKSRDEFKKKKNKAKEEGKRIFAEFLASELDLNDKVRLETIWNEQFTSDLPIDLNRVPIGFSCAKVYNGFEVDIRPEKREAIAHSMMTGSACLAYGVGLGKTWCAMFIMAQFIENGWCQRPMLALPNQVYNQFMSECRGLLPQYPVNDYYNLSPDYELRLPKNEADGKYTRVTAHTISFFTYEGFRRLGLSVNSEASFWSNLYAILEQKGDGNADRQSKKDIEKFNEKLESIIGKAQSGTFASIDTLGLDFLIIDEAHSAKKVFTVVAGQSRDALGVEKEGKPYKISAGTPSAMAIKAFMVAQYMQQQQTGNVLLLTATPFTNSPLEVYSMLALCGIEYLKKKGLDNLVDFFDTFAEVQTQLAIDIALRPVLKEVFTGFNNLVGLQQIIRRFFLYKPGDENLKRPNKVVLPIREKMVDGALVELANSEKVDTVLALEPIQQSYMDDVLAYASGAIRDVQELEQAAFRSTEGDYDDDTPREETDELQTESGDDTGEISEDSLGKDEKEGVRLLRAANLARSIALSPYLYPFRNLPAPTPKTYVESSAKLRYVVECIRTVRDFHLHKQEPVSGQIIFTNRGIEYFHLIRQYLVEEVGYKPHEVGVIVGSESVQRQFGLGDKVDVQDRFLGRRFNPVTREYEDIPDEYRLKVLIGSDTIKEGINLQRFGTVIYNCYLPWNPTDTIQLEGRIWRQGNLYKNVRIVYPLCQDSMDIFMFQKLEEKTQRINQLWDFNGNTGSLNLEDFNPAELKYVLIKNPTRVAELEGKEKAEQLDDQIGTLNQQISMLQDFNSVRASVLSFIERRKEWLGNFIDLDDTILNNPRKFQDAVMRVVEKQLLKDGRKISEVYGPKKQSWYPYREEWPNDSNLNIYSGKVSAPWGFSEFKSDVRKYDRIIKDILKPRNIPEGATTDAIEQFKEEIKEVEKQKEAIQSDEYIEKRAQEIIEQRKNTGYRQATVEERVIEFARMNGLLSDMKHILNLAGTPGHRLPVFAKGQKVKLAPDGEKPKSAEVLEVFSRGSETPMYRLSTQGGTEIVIETELTDAAGNRPEPRYAGESAPGQAAGSVTKTETNVSAFADLLATKGAILKNLKNHKSQPHEQQQSA